MPTDLRSITDFDELIAYLGDELDWPVEDYGLEDLTFEYDADELGLKDEESEKLKDGSIRQLRPLPGGQPFGIFFVEFGQARLPIVVLRRILNALVIKKRNSANPSDRQRWDTADLLFISAFGEGDDREIAFAHFHKDPDTTEIPVLRVLGWDGSDTTLKTRHVAEVLKNRLHWPNDSTDHDAWRKQWRSAFRHRLGHVIKTASDLADALAGFARKIRDATSTIMAHESETKGQLRKLHRAFRSALISDLSEDDFADTYAQTVTYGLLTAAISRTEMSEGRHGTALTQEDITAMVPVTNPFLKEMLQEFLKVGGRKGGVDFDELGINEVVELLRGDETDLPAILRDFGNRKPGEDPVIHFYEHFLAAYNKKLRIQRGVFYTPQPVVSNIVRSVHELLQTEFGLEDGLASTITWGEMLETHPDLKLAPLTDLDGDKETISPAEPFVQVLDPATGTATFLVEVIDLIYQHLAAKWENDGLNSASQKDAWNDYVPKHLLPRLHGYELMMAPYAIAHMKIGLKLAETGYRFGTEERARVYLTNALEPWVRQLALIGFDALAHEAAAVNEIKRHKRFTVVIGNPPYSNFGQLNKNPFILGLLEDYKRGLDDKKINLDDDFIKFVRYSESLLGTTGVGVHGMITNNAYLDGLTHRRMRQRLQKSFPLVRVANLHGSSKKKEKSPDGTPDENVFDITVGVAIGLFCRAPDAKVATLTYADCWGCREAKTKQLSGEITPMRWLTLNPLPENFFFVPKDFSSEEEYQSGWSIRDAFAVWQNGLKTDRDELFFDFEKDALSQRMRWFYTPELEPQFREQYQVVASSSYDIETRRLATKFNETNVRRCLYRPMDVRWLYYDPNLTSRPAEKVMKHMFGGPNLGLIATRQTQEKWDVLTTDNLCGHKSCAAYDINSLFPLYLYEHSLSFDLGGKNVGNAHSLTRRPNLNASFLTALAAKLQLSHKGAHGLPVGLTPEDIFNYAYAVFHSPGYRSRYAEFLKIDFPRLPLTGNLELFRGLVGLGGELTALHLLESPRLDAPITEFVDDNHQVSKVGWTPDDGGTVWLDGKGTAKAFKPGSSGFRPVPKEVWNFHIGGYQVCAKWLKDRGPKKGNPGRTLTNEDIAHYHKIVIALTETIRLMAEIDQVIDAHGGWPDAFQAAEKKED